jgi:alkylated DNA repair dioxygenase AlkB
MDLFEPDPTENLLPCDGEVNYFGPIMDDEEAQEYYQELLHGVTWKNDETIMFGKHIVTARKVAWYAEGNYSYSYSGSTKQAQMWTPELHTLRSLVERTSHCTYNSCLLNLYADGNEGMGWHSDNEDSLVKQGTIASVSFGAERKFTFKHRTTKETVCLVLENGSLLLMKGAIQSFWQHSLPKTKKPTGPRINLTFRTFKTT